MPNTIKVLIRTLIIVLTMAIGTWLPTFINNLSDSDSLSSIISLLPYIVFLIIGILLGSLVKPRFISNRNYLPYLIPLIIFLIIGIAPLIYTLIPDLPFYRHVFYLKQYTYLIWTLIGFFVKIIFR